MRAGIVVNPKAGRGTAIQRAEAVARALVQQGLQTELVCSDGSGSSAKLASDFAAAGCELVFAAGGDGTINEVVQGIVDSETILGVIPAGLANVWAADVGLSSNPTELAQLVRSGLVFDTDLGVAGERTFLVMAGAGLDASIVAAVKPDSKARWGPWSYVWQALACAWRWQRIDATIDADGRSIELPILGLIAANASKYAGLFDLAAESKLDDGLLEVLICRDSGLLGRARSMVLVDHRTRRFDPHAETIRTSELSITTAQPLLLHADAELAGTTPCRIHVFPRRLPVLLPQAAQRRYLKPGRALSSAAASLSHYR